MDYVAKASKITSALNPVISAVSNIQGLSFDSVWSGDAHSTLTNNLNSSLKKIQAQKEAINVYTSALKDLQTYKENKEQIDSLRGEYSSLSGAENESRRQQLSSQISSLENTNTSLKTSIQSSLRSITSVSSEFKLVKYTPDKSYGEYIVDLQEFLQLFQSGRLVKLSDNSSGDDSLYDYYSKEEVNDRINQIKSQYKGRDAAVNCALGVMEMAAQVGRKLDYDWGGGHGGDGITDIDEVAAGTDCSAFASWAINQGISNGNYIGPYNMLSLGRSTSYENAQGGDILVSAEHVVMIIDNNPEAQQFLVAEANGSQEGVIMRTRSYAACSGTYQALDLSNLYK